MIKRVAFVLLLTALPADAQMNTGMDHAVSSGGSFSGAGDVVSGAIAWWGIRAYNKAYASAHGNLANVCTPADASCQDVPSDSSGNFNLGATSLTCNNSGSICTIKKLYDQSGASSCSGACDIFNNTIGSRPTLVVPGAANGCSTTSTYCMKFATGDLEINGGGPYYGGASQPYTASFVMDNPATSGIEFITEPNFPQPIINGNNASTLTCGAGNSPTVTVSDNAYHAIQCVFNGASSDTNVDGTQNTTNAGASGLGGASTIFTLGNQQGGGANPFTGFLNEFGYWTSGFSTTQSSNMSSNQHSYWGF